MQKTCKKCSNYFVIDENDQNFYLKMKVPNPEVCPDCRFLMRAMFRNETTLYSGRKCGLCGKGVISMYNPKSPYTIYCYECFYSEKWDPSEYAMNYDESRPYIDQLGELLRKVPKITTYLSLGAGANINSEYVNMAAGCKNCYLVFNTTNVEDTMYSRGIKYIKDCLDIYFATHIERCYESINVENSSGILWSKNVAGSVDCAFILNGRGLINCFGCVNLNSKSYCFMNEQLQPDEYKKKINEIMGSYEKIEEFKNEFEKFALSFPRRENNNIKVVDSHGDYLSECKNVKDSFEIHDGENCRYLFASKGIKDSLGTIGHGAKSEKLLECVATGYSSNVIGSYGVENSTDILHSYYIANCKDSIGCDAIRNKQYAILNKVYPKDEYLRLREKVIRELTDAGICGLMLPTEVAPFAYNETIAQDNFPLEKDVVLERGFRWEDDIQKTEGKETIMPEDLPDNVKDVPESMVNEVLKCISCSRNYKITEQEILFYRKMNLPIPRKCFYCRHKERIQKRGPYKFWERTCAKCQKSINTNYSPERPEIVYCEDCYKREVY